MKKKKISLTDYEDQIFAELEKARKAIDRSILYAENLRDNNKSMSYSAQSLKKNLLKTKKEIILSEIYANELLLPADPERKIEWLKDII